MLDAAQFLGSGLVNADRFRSLVDEIPESAYVRYPTLSRDAVRGVVQKALIELS